jgi:uncharacterized protein DUF6894
MESQHPRSVFGRLTARNEVRREARRGIGLPQPTYYFRICDGDYSDSGTTGDGFGLADKDAAWAEMTQVCGDLVSGIARNLKQDSQWQMELLDEARKPMFRLRLVAETLE